MLTLLPLITIFIEKKNIYFITTFLCLILASKRTGLITFAIVIIYFFYSIQPKLSNKIKTLIVFITTTAVVYIAAIFIFPNQIERVFNRFSEIEEDGGSGRDLIFERVSNAILEGDANNLLLGHGYNTVCKSDINDGYSAHNDFLEVLYDYGIIGFILYISIYLKLWRLGNSPHLPRTHKIGCKMAFFIMLLLSFTSHLILFTNSIIFLIAFLSFTELLIFKTKSNLI